MAIPYILARTFEDAHGFARGELGLGKGHYYVVTSPATLKGIRGADLYLVPGWEKRFDRFKMASAMRWTRLNKIDVVEWRKQAEAPVVPDGLEPAGEQMSLVDATDFIVAATEEPDSEDEPPAEAPKRRRRCKTCGILVDPDEVEQHAAEHLPEGV